MQKAFSLGSAGRFGKGSRLPELKLVFWVERNRM